MNLAILGAGLGGISLAYLLQNDKRVSHIELLEKADAPGGLCRSYPFAGVGCDVGPHIMFSKNAEVLDLMVKMLGENVHKLRRSNRVFHDGRFVKYPFENDLAALRPAERDYCLHTFLENPYGRYVPQTMLQFFLTTFGEGMTQLYLRPYNEKIWKFDPAFMDTQMVERIPKPPAEDIIKSAQGASTEGYLHQLYFYYPKQGGIQSLLDGFLRNLGTKVTIRTGLEVRQVARSAQQWQVQTSDQSVRQYDRLVSTIPVPDLVSSLAPAAPAEVCEAAQDLKFNSIAICLLHVARDHLGDNFAVMVADRDILFHRLSKLDFLLPAEARDATTRIMAEITYRHGDRISQMSDPELLRRVVEDLARLGFIDSPQAVLAQHLFHQRHAYVIYDLDHRRNMRTVRDYCEQQLGLTLHGRFGEFEYMNMDTVLEHSISRAREIRANLGDFT
jgi:protoporphyrinogen oxidase